MQQNSILCWTFVLLNLCIQMAFCVDFCDKFLLEIAVHVSVCVYVCVCVYLVFHLKLSAKATVLIHFLNVL